MKPTDVLLIMAQAAVYILYVICVSFWLLALATSPVWAAIFLIESLTNGY